MMDGKIEARSEPGVGSTFTIRLLQQPTGDGPLGSELAGRLGNFMSVTRKNRARLAREYMPYGRVLVVDDVEANVFVAKGLMKPYGFEPESAANGYEVLAKVRAGEVYDIIFMDHMMPGMDGAEAARILREEGYVQPIVALTANALAGMEEFFIKNGFDGFITKPIDLTQFDHLLNTYIRDKQPPEVLAEARRNRPQSGGAIGDDALISQLKGLSSLEVESALNAMSGMGDLYIDTVRLMTRLLPERIGRLDRFLRADLRAFFIEVHGLKSVLKNIGSVPLGNAAAELERAAMVNDRLYCGEKYPVFREGLVGLESELRTVLERKTASVTEGADASSLASVLAETKAAAEAYDRDRALELISPFSQYERVIRALEAFDCEGAVQMITETEKSRNNPGGVI